MRRTGNRGFAKRDARNAIILCLAMILPGCDKKTETEAKADPERPRTSASSSVAETALPVASANVSASVSASAPVEASASTAPSTSAIASGASSPSPSLIPLEATFGTGGLGLIGTGPGIGHGGAGPGPRLKEKDVTVGRGLPPEVVRRIVRANLPRLRACYENFLKLHAKAPADAAVAFEIDKSGIVAKLVSTPRTDKELDSCVNKVFATLSFPEPEGGVATKVSYGVDFTWNEPAAKP